MAPEANGPSREKLDQIAEYTAEKLAAWDSAYEIALREIASPAEAELLLELHRTGQLQALAAAKDGAKDGVTDEDTLASVLRARDPLRAAEREILGVRYNAFINRQAEILQENGGFSTRQK